MNKNIFIILLGIVLLSGIGYAYNNVLDITDTPNTNLGLYINGTYGWNECGYNIITNPITTDSVYNNVYAYWKLDETSGNAIDSVGSNDLVETTGTINSQEGVRDGARGDLSSGYFKKSSIISFGSTDVYSYSGWVYLDSVPTGDEFYILMGGNYNDQGAGYMATYLGINSDMKLKLRSDRVGQTINYNIAGTITVPLNEWFHIAYTHNAAQYSKVYVNGVLDISQTTTGSGTTGSYVCLGGTCNPTFDVGYLDEISIWNSELSQNDILTLYNEGAGNFYQHKNDNITLQYNTCTDFTIKDDYNNTAPYEVTQLGTGYDTTSVYPSTQELFYSFNDMSVDDYTVNGATGTDGKIGGAYDFEYSDSDEIVTEQINSMSNFSTSFWINIESYNGEAYQAIYDVKTRAVGTDYVLIEDSSNQGDITIRDTYSWNTNLATGQWYFIVITTNSLGEKKLYVDNSEISRPTDYTGQTFPQDNIVIGRYNNGNFPFDGKIDDFRLYNSTLTTSQISDLYNSGSGTQYENIAPDNLVFHSTMESGSDSTSNSNDGTVNGATWTSNGVFGGAMDFDGSNDYITFPNYCIDSDYSISLWVNKSDWSVNSNFVDLGSGISTREFYLRNNAGQINFASWSQDGNNYYDFTTTGLSLNNNQWYYMVALLNNSGIFLYIDGVLVGQDTSAASNPKSCTSDLVQLMRDNRNTGYTKGQMDEFSIYNRALTQTEIQTLYNNSQNLNMLLSEQSSTPLTNSSWNITSGNLADGVATTVWNTGEQAIFTSDVASFIVTTDYNTNGSCALNRDWTYEQMVAANESYKLATTETISHSGTLADSIPLNKDNCMFCSFIKTDGTGSNTPTIIQQSHEYQTGGSSSVPDAGYYGGTTVTLTEDYYIRQANFTVSGPTSQTVQMDIKILNATGNSADHNKVLASCNANFTGQSTWSSEGCDLGGYRMIAGEEYAVIFESSSGNIWIRAGDNLYSYGHGVVKSGNNIMSNVAGNFDFQFNDQVIGGSTSGCLPITREISSTCIYSGSGNWEIDASEGCTVSESYDVGGNDIIVSGAGNILINKALSNYGNFKIQGQDASNKAYVRWEIN